MVGTLLPALEIAPSCLSLRCASSTVSPQSDNENILNESKLSDWREVPKAVGVVGWGRICLCHRKELLPKGMNEPFS